MTLNHNDQKNPTERKSDESAQDKNPIIAPPMGNIANIYRSVLPTLDFKEEETKWDVAITVASHDIHSVIATSSRDERLSMDLLRNLTAVDWEAEGIDVVYQLYSTQHRHAVEIKTRLPVEKPCLPTITDIHRGAEWAEREARGGPYDAAENLPLGARCIITGSAGPPMLNSGYNSNLQIVQGADHVMILNEMQHDARSIPLDGRGRSPDATRQWRGLSYGYWEGETLVVETANFNGKIPFRGSSEQMRVVERFTRVSDDQIHYAFTVEDEATWTRPWTAEMPLQRSRGPLFEHACHEGNYGLTNILAGARAEEARAAEEEPE